MIHLNGWTRDLPGLRGVSKRIAGCPREDCRFGTGVGKVVASDFLVSLYQQGFSLTLNGSKINVAPSGKITPEIAEQIRQHKEELLVLLRVEKAMEKLPTDWEWDEDERLYMREAEVLVFPDGGSAAFPPGWIAALEQMCAVRRADVEARRVRQAKAQKKRGG